MNQKKFQMSVIRPVRRFIFFRSLKPRLIFIFNDDLDKNWYDIRI